MPPVAARRRRRPDGSGDPDVARAAYAQIEGTGSTWSELIVQQWIADVDANGMKVVYTGGGSSKGRKDFSQNSTDFAISEIPYQGTDEQGNADTSNGREYAYLPIVAGGTAFTYQLKIGDQLVRNLRLSGETITKIFTNQITNWNDPAITADNNGRAFPSLPITPVVRSDGSGTTAQFTTWMDKEYPSHLAAVLRQVRPDVVLPAQGPRPIGQAGSDQVMNTIAGFAGNGTIGYVEYSYPVNKDYPVVKVLNKGGYYVEPTQYNVAVALTKAKINQDKSSPLYLTQILDERLPAPGPAGLPDLVLQLHGHPDRRDDPRMTTAKRQTLARLHVLLAVRGADQGRPLRLLAAAAQPGAGRLRADRQAQDGRPGRRPHRPRRAPVQQPDVRRQEPSTEHARRDRAAAGGLRQGRRGPVRHRRPAPTSRRPTTAPTPGVTVETAGRADRDGGPRARHAGGAARRRRAGRSTRTPARSSPPAGDDDRRPGRRLRRPHRAGLGPSRPTPRRSAGSPRRSLVALVLLPGLMVSSFRAATAGGAPMSASARRRRRSRRPLAVSVVALLLAGLVAAFAPAAAAPVGSDDRGVDNVDRPRLVVVHRDQGADPGRSRTPTARRTSSRPTR